MKQGVVDTPHAVDFHPRRPVLLSDLASDAHISVSFSLSGWLPDARSVITAIRHFVWR